MIVDYNPQKSQINEMDAVKYVFSKRPKKQNLTVASQNYTKISFKRLLKIFPTYFLKTFSATFSETFF